jgi:hypothetical protein
LFPASSSSFASAVARIVGPSLASAALFDVVSSGSVANPIVVEGGSPGGDRVSSGECCFGGVLGRRW